MNMYRIYIYTLSSSNTNCCMVLLIIRKSDYKNLKAFYFSQRKRQCCCCCCFRKYIFYSRFVRALTMKEHFSAYQEKNTLYRWLSVADVKFGECNAWNVYGIFFRLTSLPTSPPFHRFFALSLYIYLYFMIFFLARLSFAPNNNKTISFHSGLSVFYFLWKTPSLFPVGVSHLIFFSLLCTCRRIYTNSFHIGSSHDVHFACCINGCHVKNAFFVAPFPVASCDNSTNSPDFYFCIEIYYVMTPLVSSLMFDVANNFRLLFFFFLFQFFRVKPFTVLTILSDEVMCGCALTL